MPLGRAGERGTHSIWKARSLGSTLTRGVATAALLAVAAPAAAQDNVIATATLPRDLGPFGMFISHGLLVKLVLIGLAFASVVIWTVWLTKTVGLSSAKRRVAARLVLLTKARGIAEAAKDVRGKNDEIASLVHGALVERQLSAGLPAEGLKERIFWDLERIEAAAQDEARDCLLKRKGYIPNCRL